MQHLVSGLALAGMALVGSVTTASAQGTIVDTMNGFGTIARGSTVCVGPMKPGGPEGVQIFGFTNGQGALTWQVYSLPYDSPAILVFSTTTLGVDHTVPPTGDPFFQACVVKHAGVNQDFTLTINSSPVE